METSKSMPPYKATRSSDSTKGVMEASIEHDKHSPELGTQERHALPQAVSDFLLKPGTHTRTHTHTHMYI